MPRTANDSRIQAYLRGRLEYGRFLRQAAQLESSTDLVSLAPVSVVDFYPSDRPFGDMEQGKIVILSIYSGSAEDEEAVVATIAAFLQILTQSSLSSKLMWVIGADDSDLETLNLLLSYALLAGSIEAEEITAPEVLEEEATDTLTSS